MSENEYQFPTKTDYIILKLYTFDKNRNSIELNAVYSMQNL